VFKEAIIDMLTGINSSIVGMGQSGYLTQDMSTFNSTLYSYIVAIMQNVMMPVAYTILGLFFSFELYKVSSKVESSGAGSSLGVELVAKTMAKMVFCKIAVDSTLVIMNAIFSVSLSLTNKISGIVGNVSTTGSLNMDALKQVVYGLSTGSQFSTWCQIFLIKNVVSVIVLLVNIVIIARFIQIYAWMAFAPIPMASFPSEELSSIGKNFLKGFAAVSIQGTMIYLVLSFFPVLFNSAILGDVGNTDITGALNAVLGYSVILVIAVFCCGRWSKSICSAM
jgi:hypothetical protein